MTVFMEQKARGFGPLDKSISMAIILIINWKNVMAKVFGMNMKLKAKMNNEDAQKRNLIKRKEKTTEKQEQ